MSNNLDPKNWNNYRQKAFELLDRALDHVEESKERPVWQPVPEEFKKGLAKESPPWEGTDLEEIGEQVKEHIMPYSTGNTHPRFFGWVHGTGTSGGVIAELLSAAINANMGGREHAPIYIERQVIEWCKKVFGFPAGAGGLLTSGTSMSTLLAIAAARQQHAPEVSEVGMRGLSKPLTLYVSAQAHNCIKKSAMALGFGKAQIRKVDVNEQGTIIVSALEELIEQDLAKGLQPFCIVATAGTVNTGAFDAIPEIANVASRKNLWLHVDGAFGAITVLSETHKHLVAGIENANSLAFDFHKWLHVPYAVGCLLVKNQKCLLDTFSDRPDYLADQERGLGAGSPWFCELGLELSRGFSALKVWMTLKEHGLKRLGEMVSKNCAQASYLESLVKESELLELMSPTVSNICNLRFRPKTGKYDLDLLNTEIVLQLQEKGIAAPSTTKINGQVSIRVNITNHRTEQSDIDLLISAILDEGSNLTAKQS